MSFVVVDDDIKHGFLMIFLNSHITILFNTYKEEEIFYELLSSCFSYHFSHRGKTDVRSLLLRVSNNTVEVCIKMAKKL